MWAERGLRLDTAYAYIQEALKYAPENGAFIDALGWIYYMQGRYEAAREQIEKAAAILPDDPVILHHLGDTLFKLGESEKAREHWKQSYMIDAENKSLAATLIEHGFDLDALQRAGKTQQVERVDAPDTLSIPNTMEAETNTTWTPPLEHKIDLPTDPKRETNMPPTDVIY